MLRRIRLCLAIIFWVLITWLLVDFTGTAHAYLGWMAKIQFMPALLSLNVGVLLFLGLCFAGSSPPPKKEYKQSLKATPHKSRLTALH